MIFPIIKTENCRVVPFGLEHLTERYVAWLNDPEVVCYSEQRHRSHTIESCRRYFESFTGSTDHFLAIEASASQLGHIGNMGISVDSLNGVADVAIIIGERQVWGRGYATTAWCAVLDVLLASNEIRKVTAGTMAVNKPMLRLMNRSGMHVEAVRAKQYIWNAQEVDMVLSAKFGALANRKLK